MNSFKKKALKYTLKIVIIVVIACLCSIWIYYNA